MNDNTKAEVIADSNQLTLPNGLVNGGSVIGAAATLVVGFLALRKRWSRDNLELTKDRAETNLIDALEKRIVDLRADNQRLDENAREAWRHRAEDAKKIGELSSKVESLTAVNVHMEKQMAAMIVIFRQMLPEHLRTAFDQQFAFLTPASAPAPATTTE
jgi:hypothetical protein